MNVQRIERLRKHLEADPTDPFTQYALALEYDAGGDTPLAIRTLEELVVQSPRYVPSYQQLGYLFQKTGQADKACEIFNRGIAVARAENDLHAAGEMQEALDEM
ncbi:MAG: hypothetical protein A2X67_14380 [Ignavibacteria bacterium GWA2_55_11]|nr:MAG: hypothetical protein A2X67_14380 [Ignavibacteria bacterium GWA2_55_11]OGU44231.1 MAG: hypothetical protein A2X68_09145 [Ignavibacteria bacterium GWC2_56_12]OGU62280.1 MAG: hypothetical protein A3C56_04855 [Ignavibacteria bacterium RIFCSPHIGHO2_02_FULL_56_12]OGU75740.1 MAG: hypothetical protein A3H45_05820 [Ignavibacteria bacterium RIFCSPLOWO2_02_FULL_55_14]OGU76834.1 MAG: hypothetical protein A3G43_09865 [Ignavibacteria bacterium RIFCSPLOWO2_12_FULL_56_21]HAV23163.1 tetratricopeptide r